ncbi:hypothetical protein [Serratia proteamaculans]
MSLGTLKAVGMMTVMVVLAGNMVWLRYQQHELGVLRTQNAQLTRQNEALQTRLLQLKAQATHLSTTLGEQQTQHHQLEEQSEQIRRQLRQAVSRAPCAGQSVPADVIRLQRDALNPRRLPGRYDAAAPSGTLPDTGVHG